MKEKSKAIKFDYPLYDTISDDLEDITALYLRVSTDSQAQDGYGLDVQYDAIHKYCEAYNPTNPVVFIDDGYTGTNDKRPAFQKMRKLMRSGKVKLILTYSLDRLGRNQMIILKFLKEECEKNNIAFLAVRDNIDSTIPTFGILTSMLSIFAEIDHRTIVSKLFQGRKKRAAAGYWKGGGNPPIGYKYSKDKKNLIPDEEKAPLVKKAFEMYNSMEYSPRQIAEVLGLSSDVLIFGMLRNRTYLGEITFKGEQYIGKHEPLIDKETFERAQEILEIKKSKKVDSNYLLSALLYCGNCGAKMRYMIWGKGKNRKLKILCYSKYPSTKSNLVKDRDCPNLIYDAKEVEDKVVEAIMNFAENYHVEIKDRIITEEDVIAGMEKKIESLNVEYERMIYAFKRLGSEELLDQAEAIKYDIKRIEREIKEEREKQVRTKKIEEQEEMLRTLPDTWKYMSNKDKQAVIRNLVNRVVVWDRTVKVVLNKTSYEKAILGEVL